MRTTEELFEILGEADMAMISAEYWLNYHTQQVGTTNYLKQSDFDKLLAFQNGWLACKTFYKIRDY